MDGAHKRQKRTSDLVLCDEGEAGAKRQRVQRGVAASGRRGQATLIRAAQRDAIPTEVRKEVAKAMEAGSALVQASLEHLQGAERSWDTWIAEHDEVRGRGETTARPRDHCIFYVANWVHHIDSYRFYPLRTGCARSSAMHTKVCIRISLGPI